MGDRHLLLVHLSRRTRKPRETVLERVRSSYVLRASLGMPRHTCSV